MNFPAIDHLPFLKHLILYYNQIASLPQTLYHLNLKELFLNDNQLTAINTSFILPQLIHLAIENNHILTFNPTKLIFMPSLQTLKISRNDLQSYQDLWSLVQYSSQINDLQFQENKILKEKSKMTQLCFIQLLRNHFVSIQKIDQKP